MIKTELVNLHREVVQLGETTQKQIDQRFTAERQHTDQQFKSEREHTDQQFKAAREHVDQGFARVERQFKAEREHTDARFDQVDLRFDAIMAEFRNQRQHGDLPTRTILDAYTSFIAQNDLSSIKAVVTDLMIRVAVLESRVFGPSKSLDSGAPQ